METGFFFLVLKTNLKARKKFLVIVTKNDWYVCKGKKGPGKKH
ncbi:MAG: hypothetical protein CM15mV43_410 [uncultured marine virus]|nr:MAG: hypothetical protein CM15mV43_410 [uncultured marine virus]